MTRRPKIFIVHGHNHRARDTLATMLQELGLRPIILSKEPNYGSTLIEKFEYYANQVEFAVVLLTPDDKNASEIHGQEKFQARQNVIFEMGWFFAKYNRRGTLLLHKGKVELPSDITGILYLPFKRSPREARLEIIKTLRAAGIRLKNSKPNKAK